MYVVVGKVVAYLCLTLIIKELRFSVEHERVVTTLNTTKHKISYLVQFTHGDSSRSEPMYACRVGEMTIM